MIKIKNAYIGMSLRPEGFCNHCGDPMQSTIVGGEECTDMEFGPRFSRYDSKTGKRNMVIKYRCPRSKWYNGHSEWVGDDLVEETR